MILKKVDETNGINYRDFKAWFREPLIIGTENDDNVVLLKPGFHSPLGEMHIQGLQVMGSHAFSAAYEAFYGDNSLIPPPQDVDVIATQLPSEIPFEYYVQYQYHWMKWRVSFHEIATVSALTLDQMTLENTGNGFQVRMTAAALDAMRKKSIQTSFEIIEDDDVHACAVARAIEKASLLADAGFVYNPSAYDETIAMFRSHKVRENLDVDQVLSRGGNQDVLFQTMQRLGIQ